MSETPKRRFRFSLRTLFAITTLIAIYLGWQASIIHERKALIAEGLNSGRWSPRYADDAQWSGIIRDEPPWWPIRSLMGDRPYIAILMDADVSPQEFTRLRKVFSEAFVTDLDIPFRATGPGNLWPLDENE